MLEKEDFLNSFIESLNKNFERRSKYFNSFNYEQFTELNSLVFEINKCVILELFRATITLTNHYLERLLKLALIYNESGIGPFSVNDWDEIFNGPCEKYDSKSLGNSIELCKKEGLINEDEKEFLFFKIRELMRNGFSHADSSKILAGLPEKNTFFHGSLSTPENLQEISMNQKKIPIFQSILMDNFAKENAENYFEDIYSLSKRIERRLLEK